MDGCARQRQNWTTHHAKPIHIYRLALFVLQLRTQVIPFSKSTQREIMALCLHRTKSSIRYKLSWAPLTCERKVMYNRSMLYKTQHVNHVL